VGFEPTPRRPFGPEITAHGCPLYQFGFYSETARGSVPRTKRLTDCPYGHTFDPMAVDTEQLRILVRQGKSDPELAAAFGVTARTVLRWRNSLGLASAWTPPRAPHGSPSSYNAGCRCSACREANRVRAAQYRKDNAGREVTEHGLSGYSNWGCRCDVCKAAGRIQNNGIRERARAGRVDHVRGGSNSNCPCQNCRSVASVRRKRRNDASRLSAGRNGYEWTGPELELASRADLTAREVAAALGRTVAAVAAIRQRIANGDVKTHRLLGKYLHGGTY
jgi:hypothetical protein